MVNKDTNIFDLVEEVNKEKKKSSIQREKEMNDIYSMLDDIKSDNDIPIDDIREKVNNFASEKTDKNINDRLENYSNVVKKPEVPTTVNNYDTYSECVLEFISSVDYGTNNSREYVEGHKEALEKYYLEIKNNHKDIYVVEARINDEINSYSSKSSIRDKGYYDGLFYIHKVLKKAKELLTSKVNNLLTTKLN